MNDNKGRVNSFMRGVDMVTLYMAIVLCYVGMAMVMLYRSIVFCYTVVAVINSMSILLALLIFKKIFSALLKCYRGL